MVHPGLKQGTKQKRIFILLVILVALGTAIAFAKRGLVDSYLKMFLIKTIAYELGGDVSIIDLDIEILEPSVHAKGLRINNLAGSKTLLLARDVKVFLKPFPIFLRKIIIPRIELSGVAFSGVEDDLRNLKFEKLLRQRPKKRRIFDFEVSEIELEDIELSLSDSKKNEAYFNFSNISGNMNSNSGFVYIKGGCEIDVNGKNFDLPNIYSKLSFSKNRLTLDEFKAYKDKELTIQLRGKILPDLQLKGLFETDLTGQMISNFFRDVKGKIHIPFELSGTLKSPILAGHFQGKNISYLKYSATTLQFQFDSNGKHLNIKQGVIENQDVSASLAGKVIDWKNDLNLEVEFQRVKIASISKYFPNNNTSMEGYASGKASLRIKDLYNLRLEGNLSGFIESLGAVHVLSKTKKKLRFMPGETLNYEAVLKYQKGGNFEFDGFRVYGTTTDLLFSGLMGKEKLVFDYKLICKNLSFFAIDDYQLGGELDLAGKFNSYRGEIISNGDLGINNLSFKGIVFGNLRAAYGLNKSMLSLEDLSLIDGNSSLTVRVLYDIGKENDFSFDSELRNYDLGKVLKVFFREDELLSNLRGNISGNVIIAGKRSGYSGEININTDKLKLYDRDAGELVFKADIDSSKIILKKAAFIYEKREILNGKGYYGIDGDSDLRFKGSNINIDLVDFIQVKKYLGESFVNFDSSYTRKDGQQNLSGSFVLAENDQNDKNIPIIDLNFATDFKKLHLSGNYEGDKAAYIIDYPLEKNSAMDVHITAKDWNFVPLLSQKMTLNKDNISGVLTMEADIKGVPGNLATYTGIIRIDNFGMLKDDVELRNNNPIVITFENGGYSFDSFDLSGTQTDLTLEGKGKFGGENNISLKGYCFFNIISLFFKEFIRAEGKIDLEGSMQGTFDDIQIIGEGRVKGGVLVLRDFPNIIRSIQADLTFSHKKIILDNIAGEMGGGSFHGGGLIEIGSQFDGGVFFDAALELEDVSSLFPVDYPGLVSGTLAFKGPYFVPTLSGELTIKRLLYTKPWDWRSKIISFGERTYSLGIKTEPQIYLNIHLIAGGGNIEIRNNVAETKLSGDLRITGNDRNIGILGDVNVEKGKISFLDNEFELSEGSIKFVEEEKVLGVFDISGRTTVKGTEINLILRGTSEDPELELFSQPAKSETDIITLLTLGVESSELSAGGAAQSDLSQSLMTSVLTGAIQENIEKTFRKSKILDTFQIYPSFSEDTGTTELRVGIGRKIPYKMQILYSTDVNNIGRNQEVKLDKEITENLSLQGLVKEKTDERIDLGLNFEFKIDF